MKQFEELACLSQALLTSSTCHFTGCLDLIDPIDDYAVQQFEELHGKKLKSTTKEGLDIDDDDEKKQLEQFRAEFELLTRLMKDLCSRSP